MRRPGRVGAWTCRRCPASIADALGRCVHAGAGARSRAIAFASCAAFVDRPCATATTALDAAADRPLPSRRRDRGVTCSDRAATGPDACRAAGRLRSTSCRSSRTRDVAASTPGAGLDGRQWRGRSSRGHAMPPTPSEDRALRSRRWPSAAAATRAVAEIALDRRRAALLRRRRGCRRRRRVGDGVRLSGYRRGAASANAPSDGGRRRSAERGR